MEVKTTSQKLVGMTNFKTSSLFCACVCVWIFQGNLHLQNKNKWWMSCHPA